MNDFGSTPPRTSDPALDIRYDGARKAIAQIALMNALLTIVTLGVYRFWGKTRLRRYMWARLQFAGDRLEYTGRGIELFLGFLIALLILVPFVAADYFAQGFLASSPGLLGLEQMLYGLILWFLINVAIFRARRYRLTRTRWRGVRFTQTGSSIGYALIMMAWQFLAAVTLFLAYPFYRTHRQSYLVENTRFGNHPLGFHGQGSRLFGVWFVAWLLLIPSLGLSYLWYRVREFNYFASETRFRGLRVSADLRSGRVIAIATGYLAVLILILIAAAIVLSLTTSGFLSALDGMSEGASQQLFSETGLDGLVLFLVLAVFIVLSGVAKLIFLIHPLVAAVSAAVELSGQIEFEALVQARDEVPRRGEGLFEALDVGDI